MHCSLIVPTLNRVEPLARLLASLDAQTRRDFDVTVVDQNPDQRIAPVLERYAGKFPIRRLTCARGASRARNAALSSVTGELVAFPDDDCWYPPDLLDRVTGLFQNNPAMDGLTGRPDGDTYWDANSGRIDQYNVWKRGIEFAMFFRREMIERVGQLDETLGPGSGTPYWAGEGADYLLRAIKQGFHLEYDADLLVFHPTSLTIGDDAGLYVRKAYHYALAKGRVLSQRKLPLWSIAYQCARPAAGVGRALLKQDLFAAKVYWNVARGMVLGCLARTGQSVARSHG